MGRPTPDPAQPVWTDRDSSLLLTCMAVSDLVRRRPVGATVRTLFPLRPPATRAHFVGPVQVLALRAAGDGSYAHSSGFVFGTGAIGLAMVAGSVIGNAAGNSRRRAQAQRDAQLAWRHDFDGDVFVTDAGFVLGSAHGIGHWSHHDIDLAQMIGNGQVVIQGQAETGPVVWQLVTPWAELIFAMWALARHPQSPQPTDGSWLPPGWIAWARSHGREPWLTDAALPGRPEPGGV